MSDLLKEYVSEVLSERLFWDKKSKSKSSGNKKSKGFFGTIKNFFRGGGMLKGVVDNWLSEKELYYDVDVDEDLKQKMVDFLETKVDLIRKKVGDDEQKLTMLLRKSLDVKFENVLKKMSGDLDSD